MESIDDKRVKALRYSKRLSIAMESIEDIHTLDRAIWIDDMFGSRINPQENLDECRESFKSWGSYVMLKACLTYREPEDDHWKRRESKYKMVEREVRFFAPTIDGVFDHLLDYISKTGCMEIEK